MTRAGIILLIVIIISLFLLLGVIYPISSNGGKQGKTIEDRIQEYYSEPIDFSERPGSEPPKDTVPEGSLEAKLEIDHPPKIDETAHLTLTITSHWDFSKVRVEIGMWRERNVDREAGIKVVSGLEEFQMDEGLHKSSYSYTYFCPLMNGESRTFEFDIKVTNKGIKQITGGVGRAHQIIWYRPVCAGDGFYLDVGDTVTRISKKPFPPPPEYWVTPLVQGSGPFWGVERMLEDMEKFMKEAPGLTKWEARWLVDKAEWLGREEFTRVYAKRKEEPPSDLELRRMMIKRLIKESKIRAKKQRKSLLRVFRERVSDWKKKRPKKTWGFREDAEIKKTSPEGEDLNKSFPKRDITINVTGLEAGSRVRLKNRNYT